MAKPTNKPTAPTKTTVSLIADAHRRASIASNLAGESLLDFLSKAADARSLPILKKHGVKLPEDAAVPVSQAA